MTKSISLICTTYNEVDSLEPLLKSLQTQTQSPDEFIIVDAGSNDGTVNLIEEYAERYDFPVSILVRKSCNIAEGRNIAIEQAENDIIAVTDAGVNLNDVWVENITSPLINDKTVDVVSGYYLPRISNVFQLCTARFAYIPRDQIDADWFLPSSRSIAFRKSAWQDVNGYPEDLLMAEDTHFDISLKSTGHTFVFQPNAVAYWDHSANLRDFVRRRYSYSYWAGIARLPGNYWKPGIRILCVLTLGLVMLLMRSFLPLSFVGVGLGAMALFDYRRIQPLRTEENYSPIQTIILLSILRVLNDILLVTGFLLGSVKTLFTTSEA